MRTGPDPRPLTTDTRRVVVGVDASAEGRAALDAAAGLAQEAGLPLHLVRVWRDVDWFLSAPPRAVASLGTDEHADRRALDVVYRRARELAPDVPVTYEFTPGSLYDVLLDRCAGADLLVLGATADHTGPDNDRSPGPVGAWFIAHAPCPVRIVSADGARLDATSALLR